MSARNGDFGKEAAEADNERQREMRNRQEAQRLKIERDQQNNDACSDDLNENTSSVASASLSGSRATSTESTPFDIKIKKLEADNQEYQILKEQLDEQLECQIYELNLVQDQLEDLTNQLNNTKRELNLKSRTNSYQALQIDELSSSNRFLMEQVEKRDKLITDNNLLIYPPEITEEEYKNNLNKQSNQSGGDCEIKKIPGTALLSKDTINLLEGLEFEEKDLDNLIKKLVEQYQNKTDEVKKMKRQMSDYNSNDGYSRKDKRKVDQDDYDTLKQNLANSKSTAQEYKRELQLSQQRITSLEAEVSRLESQIKRHKMVIEESEKLESELKSSKRQLQKDIREIQSKMEDLKSENSTLQKKNEKLSKQLNKKTSTH